VALVRNVARECGANARIAGVIGPSHDGYDPAQALNMTDARRYHDRQAQALAAAGVDLLYAPTFPSFAELCGVAAAMADTGLPYALAPMLDPGGCMLDGTLLVDAIDRIDGTVAAKPDFYMIGCLYPTHARSALEAARAQRSSTVARVRGLKANASPLSPEELDRIGRLSAAPPARFAHDLWECAREFDLRLLGGCCGTDQRDLAEIVALR
jgi:S-methylmethionine-dependent homocysteine/selenocysteine methylase